MEPSTRPTLSCVLQRIVSPVVVCVYSYIWRFYPAQVASNNHRSAVNLRGDVPVFLFSNYTRMFADLKLIPRRFITPMMQFEPTTIYDEEHPEYGIFKESESVWSFHQSYRLEYKKAVAELPFAKLFPSKTNKLPKFLENMVRHRSSNSIHNV